MRYFLALVLVSCIGPGQSLKAQYYFYNDKYYENAVVVEWGGSAGIMNALTDLGGKKGIGKKAIKDLNWKNSKPSYSLFAMGMYKNAVGLRLEGTFGSIAAYDSILKDVKASTYGRYERNLSFKSRITDIQLAFEIHPLFFKNYTDDNPPQVSPYAVIGVGYYSFDPQAYLNGQWYSLQPLHTEGQGFPEYPNRKPYKLNQLNIATGLGIKYELNSLFNTRLEIVYRILSTDYLDDASTDYIDPDLFSRYLSPNQAAIALQLYDRRILDGVAVTQRGNPKNKDAFFSIQLKIGMVLGRQKR